RCSLSGGGWVWRDFFSQSRRRDPRLVSDGSSGVCSSDLQDAGKALHPAYVEGQFQGGAVQGIGWALNEEYVYGTDGKLQNAGCRSEERRVGKETRRPWAPFS